MVATPRKAPRMSWSLSIPPLQTAMTALKRKRFQQGRTTSVRVESELGEERLLQPAIIQVTGAGQVTN